MIIDQAIILKKKANKTSDEFGLTIINLDGFTKAYSSNESAESIKVGI